MTSNADMTDKERFAMKTRGFMLFGAVIVVCVALVPLAGQAPQTGAGRAVTSTPANVPRTPWGDPDLNGDWQGFTGTPFERPSVFKGREFLTDQEVAARLESQEKVQALNIAGQAYEFAFRGQHNNSGIFWYDEKLSPISRRTSRIIDPPDGRLPLLTPQALQRWEAREAMTEGRGEGDSYVDRSLGDRCLEVFQPGRVSNWGLGASRERPASGDDAIRDDTRALEVRDARPVHRIFQAPGFVAVVVWVGDGGFGGGRVNRYIPITDRPHSDPTVRNWFGESRGHWEGNSLVIETKNLNYPDEMFSVYGGTTYPGTKETLRVIERYTLVDATHLEYRYTIEDPETYTRPYTVRDEFERAEGLQISPDLCHENNKDLASQLATARADEAAALDYGIEGRNPRLQRLKEY